MGQRLSISMFLVSLCILMGSIVLVSSAKSQSVRANADVKTTSKSLAKSSQSSSEKFIFKILNSTASRIPAVIQVPNPVASSSEVDEKVEVVPPAASSNPVQAEVKKEEAPSKIAVQPKETPAVVAKSKPTPPSYSAPFQWGITMRPNAVGNYNATNWQTQINKAKELKVGWSRVNWEQGGDNPESRNKEVIDALVRSGLEIILVIEHNPALGTDNMYRDGLNDGKKIATQYKGKIHYYQLANEGGAEAIKDPTAAGLQPSEFDDLRYAKIKDYIKGLSEGISSVEASAVKIVTVSSTHTGFIERLVSDKVNFDMLGVDWYDWMGSFQDKKVGNDETYFERLKSFGKPLTFMEVNILPEATDAAGKQKTIVDEDKQANYISQMAKFAWTNRDWFKGFYVLELVDNINVSTDWVDYYGLIKADRLPNGVGVLKESRKSFNVFREIITNPNK